MMTPNLRHVGFRQPRIATALACLLLVASGAVGCSRAGSAEGASTDGPSSSGETSAITAAQPHARAAADGHLHGERPWARATPPNAQVAGAYVTLRNDGTADDRLVSVSSPDANRVEIHEMRNVGGAMQMRMLADGVAVSADQTVELKPGGIHLMFVGPTHAFKTGSTVQATLTFAHAPQQTIDMPVQPLGAMNAPGTPVPGQ